ncbi:hypothetical protein DL96DRAFT_1586201 [Flagelloscypha sp. PMI_526]|nr:hypothetical protein DL96DRAFT_1586201 [Flagelloscypha sp. PMI_526]
MQLSEMGVVLWFLTHDLPELLTSSAGDQTVAAQRFILLFLYLPTAFFHAAWKFEDTNYSQQNLFDAMKSPSQLLHPDSWVRDPRIDRTGPRIFFSKAVVVLTAVKLAIMIVTGDVAILVAAIVISATIIIHHLLSFFITPILPQAVDFALLILEFLIVGNSDDYTPVIVLAIFQRIALFFLLHYRTWDIVTNIRAPLQRFNLVPSYPRDGSRLALILGRRAWVDMSLKGEPAGVKAVRAALAIAFVAAIIVFSAILISRGMASSRDEVALKYFNLQESSGTLSSIGHAVLLGPSERARRTFSVVLDNPNILQVTQTCDNETTPAPCTRCENASPPTEFIFSYLCWTCKPSLPNAPSFSPLISTSVPNKVLITSL